MIEIRTLEPGKGMPKDKNAAFCAIVSRGPKYRWDEALQSNVRVGMQWWTLLILRWNAKFGFPGGKVEAHEPMYAAAVRELYEETGVDFIAVPPHPQHAHAIYEDGKLLQNVHLFECVVEWDKFLEAHRSIGEHHLEETFGSIVVAVEDGMWQTLPLEDSVREEMADLGRGLSLHC